MLHLTHMQAEISERFLQGDVMLLDENKTKPNQHKSLQAMEELLEKCTKSYGGCNIRSVVQTLQKRSTQVKKEDTVAISDSVLGFCIKKSMGGRERKTV